MKYVLCIKIVANFLVGLVIYFTHVEDLIHMIFKSVDTAIIIVVFLDASSTTLENHCENGKI